jgi:hypothetical protein
MVVSPTTGGVDERRKSCTSAVDRRKYARMSAAPSSSRARRTPPSGVQRRAGPAWWSPLRPECRCNAPRLHCGARSTGTPGDATRGCCAGAMNVVTRRMDPWSDCRGRSAASLDERLRRVGSGCCGLHRALVLVTFVVPGAAATGRRRVERRRGRAVRRLSASFPQPVAGWRASPWCPATASRASARADRAPCPAASPEDRAATKPSSRSAFGNPPRTSARRCPRSPRPGPARARAPRPASPAASPRPR